MERGSRQIILLKPNDPIPYDPARPMGFCGITHGGGLSMETIRALRREAVLNDHPVGLLTQHRLGITEVSLYLQHGGRGPGEPGWCVFKGTEDRFKVFLRVKEYSVFEVSHVEIDPSLLPGDRQEYVDGP